MSRSAAREIAMKLVYSRLLGGEGTLDGVMQLSGSSLPIDAEDAAYVSSVTQGVGENAAQIDELITRHATGWSIDRIGRVDLAIMRVAIYEMLYREDIPTGASINEAVELAKTYGGEKSYAFINGILGTLARELAAGDRAKLAELDKLLSNAAPLIQEESQPDAPRT